MLFEWDVDIMYMSTRRPISRVTEREGVSFIREIVEGANCIFEQISLENDQGNDCYIEFIDEEVATSFCVFAQIKSGASYQSRNGGIIPTDSDHLTYWANQLLPVIGFVYNPNERRAFWVNITDHIRNNPSILEKKCPKIRVENEFSSLSFSEFMQHCIHFMKEYKGYENYGRSLEEFSNHIDPIRSYEALKSLYTNHWDKSATLFVIVKNFSRFEERGIQFNILGLLSNLTNNPHVFWNGDNMNYYPTLEKQRELARLITVYFQECEVEKAISFLREGVSRTNTSYPIFLLLGMNEFVSTIMERLIFKANLEVEERNFRMWLYIHFTQWTNKELVLSTIGKYIREYPDDEELYLIEGMRDDILDNNLTPIG